MVSRGADGRIESMIPQRSGIRASYARPSLPASSPTGAVVVLETQGVCVPVAAIRQVNRKFHFESLLHRIVTSLRDNKHKCFSKCTVV